MPADDVTVTQACEHCGCPQLIDRAPGYPTGPPPEDCWCECHATSRLWWAPTGHRQRIYDEQQQRNAGTAA